MKPTFPASTTMAASHCRSRLLGVALVGFVLFSTAHNAFYGKFVLYGSDLFGSRDSRTLDRETARSLLLIAQQRKTNMLLRVLQLQDKLIKRGSKQSLAGGGAAIPRSLSPQIAPAAVSTPPRPSALTTQTPTTPVPTPVPPTPTTPKPAAPPAAQAPTPPPPPSPPPPAFPAPAWVTAVTAGRIIIPGSAPDKAMKAELAMQLMEPLDEWPGKTRGRRQDTTYTPYHPSTALTTEQALAHAIAPLPMRPAQSGHCSDLASLHRQPYGDSRSKLGSVHLGWKKEYYEKVGGVLNSMNVVWWNTQGNLLQAARASPLNDPDVDISYLPRLAVDASQHLRKHPPWSCGAVEADDDGGSSGGKLSSSSSSSSRSSRSSSSTKGGGAATRTRTYCSPAELSKSAFLAELERRLHQALVVEGFKTFGYDRASARLDIPHRQRPRPESPGHMIFHSDKFKAELVPAYVTPDLRYVVPVNFVPHSAGHFYPAVLMPIGVIFPLKHCIVADTELPCPQDALAYATADNQGEYTSRGGDKRTGHPCLLWGNRGCGKMAEVRATVTRMRRLKECGYSEMLAAVDRLSPPFASAPDGTCFTHCEETA